MSLRKRISAIAAILAVAAVSLEMARTDQPPAAPPAPPQIVHAFPAIQTDGAPAREDAADGATEAIYARLLAWFDRADGMVDRMVPAAEAAADKLIAGGTLYVAGNGGFCDEMDYRAGGFPFTFIYDSGKPLGANDVVLIGQFAPNDPGGPLDGLLRQLQWRRLDRGLAICFAGKDWPQVDRGLAAVDRRFWGKRLHLMDTGAPAGGEIADVCLAQTATVALAWAFKGEIMAAATRKGKTLATYASDWEPAGRKWDESVKGLHVHPKYHVPPIAAGVIGRKYLAACREQLAEFARTQAGQVRLAARRMARSIDGGGMVWIIACSHVHPRGSIVPRELPEMQNFGREFHWWDQVRRLRAGDVLLWIGYLRPQEDPIRAALARGAEAVTVWVDPAPTTDRRTHIRGCWQDFDTVIDLEGYPIRVLPTSGVVGTGQWYALMAETIAARAGK